MYTRKIIIVAVICSVHSIAFSQADSALSNSSVMALSKGSQAVQFFLLGQVTVAYKLHLSNQSALRFSADISGFFQDRQEDYTRSNQSTESRDQTINNQSIELGAEYLYYLESASRVKFFVGGGPSVVFARSKHVQTSTTPSSSGVQSQSSEQTQTFWDYGIRGSAGIECHVYDFVSLLAEYQILASYGPHKYESTYNGPGYLQPSQNEQLIKTWTVQLSSVQIGVAVYI